MTVPAVRNKRASTAGASAQAKAINARYALFATLAVGLAALMISGHEPAALTQARIALSDAAAPILETASRPIDAIESGAQGIERLMEVHAENARLREEVTRLKGWKAVAEQLERENAALRALGQLKPEPRVSFLTARVISDNGGPFVDTALINVGRTDGVTAGEAVVDGDGLVGRVVEVGAHAARVLLVTDLNSRIPVTVEPGGWRGVATGDNSRRPKIEFLAIEAKPKPGDRVYTSGHGGILPPGVPVGVVASVDGDAVRIAPLADLDRLEYVRMLKFNRDLDIDERVALRRAGAR